MRTQPVRLARIAMGMAGLAMLLFLATSQFAGDALVNSGATHPPAWALSIEGLDSGGVYDTDGDGLADALENLVYGSDPTRWDTSGNGIPDGWLVRHGLNPLDASVGAQPAARPPPGALSPVYANEWPSAFWVSIHDVYAHGRPADWNESTDGTYESGLDPTRWDSLGDGIPDGWLLKHGLDPLESDIGAATIAGATGLTVREALYHGSDPRKLDSDGDGILDREEVLGPINPVTGQRFNPTRPSEYSSAGSGVCDGYLVAHGLDPNQPANSYGDLARSGASTVDKFQWSLDRFGDAACIEGRGLDPTKQSTVGGPIPDGWLIRYGVDPLSPDIPTRVTQSSEEHLDGAWEIRTMTPEGLPELPHVTLTFLDAYQYGRPSYWDEGVHGPWWGGTDPTKTDTDGDGLPDSVEIRGYYIGVATDVGPGLESGLRALRYYRSASDPTRGDTTGDGLTDFQEVVEHGTDPARRDTDADGIPDAAEVFLDFGLDPTRADSAGDYLRDGARLKMLEQRAALYAVDSTYEYAGEPGKARDVRDWVAAMGGAQHLPRPLQAADVARLVGPAGDLNDNGIPNILDSDIDQDGLLNGWEEDPRLYAFSLYGVGEFQAGRAASDPLNPDTDGDGLLDGWEVKYGRPDYDVLSYALNPSKWDSNGNGVSDGNEDFDEDGATWYAYETGEDPYAQAYPFTNILEQQYGTDPNRFDSDGDGLADGWKIFWGLVYPGLGPTSVPGVGSIYPGAPGPLAIAPDALRPQQGVDQSDAVIARTSFVRYVIDPTDLLPSETTTTQFNVINPDGGRRTVYRIERQVQFTFLDAQNAKTNPYLIDTDGDGMPDWWEALSARPFPGSIDASGQPVGECWEGPGPDPLWADAGIDADDDGLPNLEEFVARTNPLCADSDLAGIRDGQEFLFGLDPMNPSDDQSLLQDGQDTDGDGLLDFEELTGIRSVDYRYLGSNVRARHDNPDTDGDGLLDGATMPNPLEVPQGWSQDDPRTQRFLDLGITYYRTSQAGFFFLGERDRSTDPRNPHDAGIDVPAGWLAAHNLPMLNPDPSLRERYMLGMPAWWDQLVHGPWWGGASPSDDLATLRRDNDLDRDGLRDADGTGGYEDPMPGANHHNTYRSVDFADHGVIAPGNSAHPADEDLDPTLRRLMAQAYLNPRIVGATHYGRDPSLQDNTVRILPCIRLDSLPDRLTLFKGTPTAVAGHIERCQDGAPVANVTVEARLGDPNQVFGAGFSGPDGRFLIEVNVTMAHALEMPAHATVFRGNTSGVVKWTTDASAVLPGHGTMAIRSYATPTSHSSGVPALHSTVEPVPVTVRAESVLTLSVPAIAPTGSDLPVGIRLVDSGGTPLEHLVVVSWAGKEYRATTRVDGTAQITVPTTHAMAGNRTLHGVSVPTGSSAQYVTAGMGSEVVWLQRPTDLRITSHPESIDAGQRADFTGRLVVPGGQAPGVPIHLIASLSGRTVVSATIVTAADGTFAGHLLLPADAMFGNYIVTMTAPSGATTQASQTSVALPVRSLPRLTGVGADHLTAGEAAIVTGRLVEPDGSTPVPNAAIHVELDSQKMETKTDAQGRFTVSLDGDLPSRPLPQRVVFAGDSRHIGLEHRSQRMVVATTSLEVPDGRVGRGLEAVADIRLMDARGHGVPQVPLLVSWGDDDPRMILTDAAGVATYRRPGLGDDELGQITLRAAYAGSADGALQPSNGKGTWTVQTAAEIILPNGAFELGTPLPPAVLRDPGIDVPLAGRTIQLHVDNQQLPRIIVTDEHGRFQALTNVPREGEPGKIELFATFLGDYVYGPAHAASTIDYRSPTIITLRSPQTIVAGRESLVMAELTAPGPTTVDDGDVRLTLDGVEVAASLVKDGTARIQLKLPADHRVGRFDLQAHYTGDILHMPSSAGAQTVVLAPVELKVETKRAAPGTSAVIKVTATAAGQPLAYAPLYLAVGGIDIGLTAITDAKGVAAFTVRQTDQAMPIAARYPGDDANSAAFTALMLEPMTLPRSVTQGTPIIAWIALAAAVSLTAATAAAAYLRRQPLEAAFRRAASLLEARGRNETQIMSAYRVLEDAAIAHRVLFGPALTARHLEQAFQKVLPHSAHGDLDVLIGLFEDARYGIAPMPDARRMVALQALTSLLKTMGEGETPAHISSESASPGSN